MMVVAGDKLYLASTIDFQQQILDMAVWDNRLVLAAADGVKFLTLD